MKRYIILFKKWYDLREKREKLLTLGLSLATIYGIFSLFFIMPIDNARNALEATTKDTETKIDALNIEVDAVKKLSASDIYKHWLQDNAKFKSSQSEYKILLKSASNQQWENIIKTILTSEQNVVLTQIKNIPETIYNPFNIDAMKSGIYQQQFQLTVVSNYFDTLNYLKHLEAVLPNIHWDSLHYKVDQYPMATIEMEFSVLYEKS